ncbi:MAG: hypothetical protein HFF14_04160 [Angelakisella sp.]|jgi:hypothetical protein|nr:hypothetical protein [Angelakisella sp.]
MYTKKELESAANIIKKIAYENHVTEAQVRADMEEAMNLGRNNPDPAVQARWALFQYAGSEPTVEEFILWTAAMAKDRIYFPVPHPQTHRRQRRKNPSLPS